MAAFSSLMPKSSPVLGFLCFGDPLLLSVLHPVNYIRAEGNRSECGWYGLPLWLSSKESTCNAEDAGDLGWIPGSGRSPGGGHGNSLKYCCLKNPKDREAWWATVHGVTKSWTRLKWLCTHKFTRLLFLVLLDVYLSLRQNEWWLGNLKLLSNI